MNYLSKSVIDSYTIFLFIMSCIIIGLKYKSVKGIAVYPLLTLLVDFCDFNGNLFPVRQNLSYALTLYSTKYIIRRELFKFLITISIAASFHMSAWLFIPAYYLYNIKINCRVIFIFFIIILGVIFGDILFGIKISDYFFQNLMGVEGRMAEKAMNYQNELLYDSSAMPSIYGNLRIAILGVLLFYCRKKYIRNSLHGYYDGFFVLWLVGTIVRIIFSDVSQTLAGRLTFYYTMFEIFLIPMIIMFSDKLYYRILCWFVFAVYFGVKYYAGFMALPDVFIPYKSIFDFS